MSRKKDASESIKCDQSAYKHIAFKVTFFFASVGKLHKIFSFIWVCPTENKTHLRYFPAFSIPLIFCRLSHYFRFILKASPADTEPRVWEEKRSKQFIFDMCGLIALSSPLATHTHTHTLDFTAIQTRVSLHSLQRRPRIDGFPAKWPVAVPVVINSCMHRNEMFWHAGVNENTHSWWSS